MFRHDPHRGASTLVLCGALAAGPVTASAQTNSSLPPVTIDAPRPRPAVRPAKRPQQRTAAAAARSRRSIATAPVNPPGPQASRVTVSGGGNPLSTPPMVARYQLPQQSFSTTAKQIEETINLKDPEDAVKYMPSLFVRKRNDGDNQAVLATRTWGLASSARTLIYADDLLISALIGNNNSGASPHWNLVSPDSIARIDFLNGPFSAAYPGNSIGGVLLITTKMPDHLFVTAKETVSVQPWNQYGTKDTYVSSQTSMSAGDKVGALSWLLSANVQDGYQQPLTYTTFGTTLGVGPANTNGTIAALNKQGQVANVVGTGALIHTQQTAANLKLAYDLTSTVQATYSLGIWNNVQTSNPQTYLTSTATGAPTFGNVSAFASNKYTWDQTHLSNAISLKSDTRGVYDFDISASSYNYLQDILLNPYTVTATGAGFSQNGKITRNDGTNWQNVDVKNIWRPFGIDGPHEVSFGVHGDRYSFNNPTYASTIWNNTSSTGTGQFYADGAGETRTGALWMQDAWKIVPNLKLTLGGRLETWRALDGFNINTVANTAGIVSSTVPINQPELSSTNFSPKASLSFDPNKDWNITASFGEAYRYPTVTELYQNITINGVATFANPNLTPEQDLTTELNIERHWTDGRVRLTLFHERTNNAIISQTNTVIDPNNSGNQGTATTIGNVAAIRMQGIEASAEKNNVLVDGLQLFGSVTYVDSRILADPTWSGKNPLTNQPDAVVGNRVPYVPDWRAKFGVTYRPNDQWAWTVAARYSGKQYSTLDNTDVVPHVYGAFDNYFVVDMKIHYNATRNFSFDVGIDNVFNEQYFLFHPFPGRTYVAATRYTF
jgi:iron complex outermembrane recepter protein